MNFVFSEHDIFLIYFQIRFIKIDWTFLAILPTTTKNYFCDLLSFIAHTTIKNIFLILHRKICTLKTIYSNFFPILCGIDTMFNDFYNK